MPSYGSDYTARSQQSGDVVADGGATIISPFSEGETAILAGPALLREIQAGVANGDFAVSPQDPTANISAENNLPYWTFTDTDSAGAITCAIVADSTTGSGNKLRWTVAAGTTTGKTATLSRYVAIPATSDRSYSSYLEVAAKYGGSATSRNLILKLQFYTSALVATGTAVTRTYAFSSFSTSAVRTAVFLRADGDENLIAPADAAYAKIELAVDTSGTNASESTLDVFEVKLLTGVPMLMVVPRTGSDAPASIWKDGQLLQIASELPSTWTNGALTTTQAYLGLTSTAIVLGNAPARAESDFEVEGSLNLSGNTLSTYDKGGSADTTTITTAGTYYALTNAEVSFSPQFADQRWLLTFTGYASLNTTTIQYCFVRANVTTTANVNVVDLGFSRADNFGTSGRGATVAFTKVYVATAADVTAGTRKFKLYGTTQTTNGLTLSLAYTQMTAYPIG